MGERSSIAFLWLEITGRCQLACVHCYAGSSPSGSHGSMITEDWKRVIGEAADAGVRTVQFIGGEPTLHPGLADLIDYALRHTLKVEVFTNLVHVTDILWETFSRPGVSLATSYYSADPGRHAAITGRPTHARTRANIAKAVGAGIPLRAGIIDLDPDQHTDRADSELAGLGVRAIGYDRFRGLGRGARGDLVPATQLCGQCGLGSAAVSPDGTVWPCVMARWMAVGNVRQHSLGEILAELPGARADLTKQGMRVTVDQTMNTGTCTPCGPQGNCYPIHCHPR
ncbi:radical SAM protein [Amycolatopsis pigmentata]|uniref:Radical SAM protein n=1 Tax=Amycolatopsis pigmentata TaxID=450801 RepID=A0ABW5FXU5_9PSEU